MGGRVCTVRILRVGHGCRIMQSSLRGSFRVLRPRRPLTLILPVESQVTKWILSRIRHNLAKLL